MNRLFSSFILLGMPIYNLISELKHLKIETHNVTVFQEKHNCSIIARCTISNRSKNEITITSIYLLLNNNEIQALEKSVCLSYIGVEVLGHQNTTEENTIALPLRLKSYDSIETTLIFPASKSIKIPKKSKVILKTARGNKKVGFKFNKQLQRI